ncbi:type II toxin-antitoxin system PemK/MazF family toxin [Weissella halotolerans]|nr:type II toxin-antitoxin system PemK/MazF family toxin [Weissella halotolerans]
MTHDNSNSKHTSADQLFTTAFENFKTLYSKHLPKYRYLPQWTYTKSKLLLAEADTKGTPNQKVYQRACIIYIDFGINIGKEFSGPHFAVVLNKEDNPKNEKLTVVPLTSKRHKHTVPLSDTISESSLNFLGDSFAEFLESTYAVRFLSALEQAEPKQGPGETDKVLIDQVKQTLRPTFIKSLHTEFKAAGLRDLCDQVITHMEHTIKHKRDAQRYLRAYIARAEGINEDDVSTDKLNYYIQGRASKQMNADFDNFLYVVSKYNRYNRQTYARLEDITTISKRRIRKINRHDPIGKIKVSSKTLDTIDEGLAKLFFK